MRKDKVKVRGHDPARGLEGQVLGLGFGRGLEGPGLVHGLGLEGQVSDPWP